MASADIACEIFNGKADLNQGLLDVSTNLVGNRNSLGVNLLAQQIFHRFTVSNLSHEDRVFGVQDQVVIVSPIGIQVGALHQLNPSVAGDIIDYLGDYVLWHIIFGVLIECVQDRPDFHPRSGGIPQRKGCDAVGVDMFGALFQFRKGGKRVPRPFIKRAVHFEEYCPVALDN